MLMILFIVIFVALPWLSMLIGVVVRRRLAVSLWHMMWHGSMTELCARWLWQWPQCHIGWLCALWVICMHREPAVRLSRHAGVIFLLVQNAGSHFAISLGFVVIVQCRRMPNHTESFERYFHTHPVCMHEFGHVLDSRQWGWLYLPVIGLPSLLSAIWEGQRQDYAHNTFWTERRANRLAARRLQSRGVVWNDLLFPRDKKRLR